MEIETTTKTTEFEKPHIKEGMYVAALKEVKDISEGQYGARVAFVYTISENVETPIDLAHICYKNKATTENKIGKVLIAHGLELKDGNINTDPLIGTKVSVLVEDYDNEGDKASIITKVKPIN